MLNSLVLVGRIQEFLEDGIILRSQGMDNKTLVIKVAACSSILDSLKTYCKADDLVGVKGTLVNEDALVIINADKVTFLSSTHAGEDA
jgi:hypothetical protein